MQKGCNLRRHYNNNNKNSNEREEAEKQIKGFSKAQYKKFETRFDAIGYIILKSPSKNTPLESSLEQENLTNKSPQKTPHANRDLSAKKDTISNEQQNLSSSHKRKLDFNDANRQHSKSEASISASTSANSSIESKDLQPQQHKQQYSASATKIKEQAEKKAKHNESPKNAQKQQINNQRSYLTEYEDKKIDFSFKGQKVLVYTDGACSNNGKPTAVAGIGVYWGNNHPLNVSKRLNGYQTNNRAEITAAIVAISQALNYNASEITVYTDSQFMINCMQSWIKKWKMNGWKSSDGKSVKNIDDLKRLDDLVSKMKTNWEYVPGHKGIHGNEEADKLATQCLR